MSEIDPSELIEETDEYEHRMNTVAFFQVERKIWQNPLLLRPHYLCVWIWLQSQAYHGKKKDGDGWRYATSDESQCVMFAGQVIALQPNQLVCGRKQICTTFSQDARHRIPEATVQRILDAFENAGMIEQLTTQEKRLITIKEPHPTPLTSDDIKQQLNKGKTTTKPRSTKKISAKEHFNKNVKNETNNDSYDSNVKNHKNLLPATEEKEDSSVSDVETVELPSQPPATLGAICNLKQPREGTSEVWRYLSDQLYTDMIAKGLEAEGKDSFFDWFQSLISGINRCDRKHFSWVQNQIMQWAEYCVGDVLEATEPTQLHKSFEEWICAEHGKDMGESF